MYSLLKHIFSLLLSQCSCCGNSIPSHTHNVFDEKQEENKEAFNKELPNEIIEEILSRLPVKSILQLRCVCKSWCALINNPHFVNLHLHQSHGNDNFILLKGLSNLYKLDYDTFDLVVKLDYPLNIPSSGSVMSCCNGLICIPHDMGGMWLWNPSIRKYKALPQPLVSITVLDNKCGLGFGYNSTSKDYEIVRIVSFYDTSRHSQVEIYSLSKNSWTRIQTTPYSLGYMLTGKLFNGVFHWVGTHNVKPRSHIGGYIVIAFDIGSREFGEVQLPDYEHVNLCWMDVSVLDEYLCLLCHYCSHFEVWVMKEYGVRESWIKLFTSEECTFPLGITKKGEFILQQNNKKLCWYDPKDQSWRDLTPIGIPEPFFMGTGFVESLVLL